MTRPKKIFLGADIGATHTRVLLADEDGSVLGFGLGGPGNHEAVGYSGLVAALSDAMEQACAPRSIPMSDIAMAGMGVAGLDWEDEIPETECAIRKAGVSGPLKMVNDTTLGILAGTERGWGIAVVAGTGCNCWGWNPERTHIAHVTGGGRMMGEAAGASELVMQAVEVVSQAWTRRGPATSLTQTFLKATGAKDEIDLLEGLMNGRHNLTPSAAPLVFQTAREGDAVANGLIEWAGSELGELVRAVTNQLGFQDRAFELVMVGSLFDGRPGIEEPLRRKVATFAPRAEFVRLTCPPVVGAVLLAMESDGVREPMYLREKLIRESLSIIAERENVR